MQNAFRTRNAHRENYSSGEIFWHKKSFLVKDKKHLVTHFQLLSHFCQCREKPTPCGDVTEAFTNTQSWLQSVSSVHWAQPGLSWCTLIAVIFNYNYQFLKSKKRHLAFFNEYPWYDENLWYQWTPSFHNISWYA